MCYEPQRLDSLPMRWTEFQHVHMVITDGQDQKVPFEGGICAFELLFRRKGCYFLSNIALRNKHGRQWEGSDIIMVAKTIKPLAGAWYQWGHGLRSIFKWLFHSAIPLLKGPVLRAVVRIASSVLRGKTMKQALKNRIAPLVGGLVQAATARPAKKHATQTMAGQEASASSRAYPETPSPRRHICMIKEADHRPGSHSHASRSCWISLQAYKPYKPTRSCMPRTKSKLDLESVRPLEIGLVDNYLVCTGPKSGPKSGGPLEFLIPASGDDYLDLSHC